MISVLLMFSPLILAAALIGIALLGGVLGSQRRRFAERYVLTPIVFVAVAALFAVNMADRHWVQAALNLAAGIAWFFRWRSIRSKPVLDNMPGGAA